MTHSHDPSTDISGHPSFRKLEPDNIQIVKEMTLSGIPPRQILSSLRQQNPNIPATSRTIYNVKKKIRKDTLGGRSEINVLFEEFEKGGFLHDVKHDSQGRITHLFMAHPLSVKLAKSFSNIFVMDCTYKTNRINMPLLDIIGVSCFNTSFYSGFAFLKTETVESYEWALEAFKVIFGHTDNRFVIMSDRELALMNAINNIFPSATNLLCVWHIQKNVVSNCKGFFEHVEEFDIFMSSWNNIVYSTTEDMFVHNWNEFELLYREKKDAIAYVKKNCFPWKEKFVSAWTEKHLHFGNRSSSRAEGAHAKLKLYLQVSTGGFKEVCDKMCLVVKHEFNEIKVKLASEKIKVPHDCNTPVYRKLLYNVSQFALKEICKQYEKITKGINFRPYIFNL